MVPFYPSREIIVVRVVHVTDRYRHAVRLFLSFVCARVGPQHCVRRLEMTELLLVIRARLPQSIRAVALYLG